MSDEEDDFAGAACREAVFVPADVEPSVVYVRHPGYPGRNNVLYKADAYTVDAQNVGWVLRQTVQDILMGFTGNTEVGFINCSREPQGRVVTQKYLRTGRDYYFHLGPNSGTVPKLFAVIPWFRLLPFEREQLGSHWRDVSQPQRCESFSTGECIMGGGTDGTEKCHVVPESEEKFWMEHRLGECALRAGSDTSGYLTMNDANIIRLESTLHEVLDNNKSYFFYPWKGQYRIYFFRRSIRLARVYHGRALRGGIDTVPPEYFYLRMMFNAFMVLQQEFLFQGGARLVRDENGKEVTKTSTELLMERKAQSASTSGRKRKSASPDKALSRSHSQPQVEGVEDADSDVFGEDGTLVRDVQNVGLKRKRRRRPVTEEDPDSGYEGFEDQEEHNERMKRKYGPNRDILDRGRMMTRKLDEDKRVIARKEEGMKEWIERKIAMETNNVSIEDS
ncbi:hypothetical protein FH972_024100 [Carpinus fangiana]|uniref:HNH nuclease domain-containing protein n=1 Tax=Carpinus fangiana TaxID=176857 RepID=A0A5N6KXJ5_9ROSI|nr:hypothetical protein FH972_024100 [Carpinus fangiana]